MERNVVATCVDKAGWGGGNENFDEFVKLLCEISIISGEICCNMHIYRGDGR